MFLYIKYGELVLKGKNRKLFVNKLYQNIKYALKAYKDLKIIKSYDFASIDNIKVKDFDNVVNILKFVSGIQYIINSSRIKKDINTLLEAIYKQNDFNNKTFRVSVKRSDKSFKYNSMEFAGFIAHNILKMYKKAKVDLTNYDIEVMLEVKNDCFVLYNDKIKGMGGFPLGMSGKVLCLISGGIDSPVAAQLLLKKGYVVDYLTFITPPHTKPKALKKTIDLIKVLSMNGKIYSPKVYIHNFTNIQHELKHISDSSYQITLMRRCFFRIARNITIQNKYDAIATGESLGQVASQTIESMQCIQNAIDSFLVLRPLLTFDKIEIINMAKKFNTYNISILPYDDSCALFVPKNPVTKPTIKSCEYLEKQVQLALDLCTKIDSSIKIKII